jgi:hypothetical protein
LGGCAPLACAYMGAPQATVQAVGAAMTARGIGRVTAANEQGGRFQQVCRGVCDDLDLKMSDTDNTFTVCAFNAGGEKLACNSSYTTHGVTDRFRVGSGPQLVTVDSKTGY